MNSVILEELQKIMEQSGNDSMPQKSVNQLLLASLVSLMQAVTEIDRKIDAIRDVSQEVTNLRNEVRENYVKKTDIDCEDCTASEDIRTIRGNLAYKVGDFVISKPKAATYIVVIIVLVSLIILGYADAQAIRLVIARAIGVPDDVLFTPVP